MFGRCRDTLHWVLIRLCTRYRGFVEVRRAACVLYCGMWICVCVCVFCFLSSSQLQLAVIFYYPIFQFPQQIALLLPLVLFFLHNFSVKVGLSFCSSSLILQMFLPHSFTSVTIQLPLSSLNVNESLNEQIIKHCLRAPIKSLFIQRCDAFLFICWTINFRASNVVGN